jgi:hypothetical protein
VGLVPAQAPPHPEKYELASALALRVTFMGVVSFEYIVVQSEPQFIPCGELVTVPLPTPEIETLRATDCAFAEQGDSIIGIKINDMTATYIMDFEYFITPSYL